MALAAGRGADSVTTGGDYGSDVARRYEHFRRVLGEALSMSEYDVPGLTAAAPAFADAARRGDAAARAITRLRTTQHTAKARLPVDLAGLDARLRTWAEEVGRSAELLHRTATEVGDADRRAALELSAAHGAVPATGRPDRPAGVGLHRGDSGAAVRALQRRLAAAGADPGPVDGRFGPADGGGAAGVPARAQAGRHRPGRPGDRDRAAQRAGPGAADEPARGQRPAAGGGADRSRRRRADVRPAAQAFHRMDAAATAAGHDLHVNSGYRTYAEQAALYQAYRNGTGNLAAPPGHSTHGLGLSADVQVTDPATLRWLRAHADTYGFVNDVPSEAWHWTWRP